MPVEVVLLGSQRKRGLGLVHVPCSLLGGRIPRWTSLLRGASAEAEAARVVVAHTMVLAFPETRAADCRGAQAPQYTLPLDWQR